jgi:hypothetical protein
MATDQRVAFALAFGGAYGIIVLRIMLGGT